MKEKTEREALLGLMAMCAKAEHCEYEMTEKMHRWGLPDDAQARILQKLVDGKYVDDVRYAKAFVHDKVRFDKWGRRKIDQALWAKHIGEDVRRMALGEISDGEYTDALMPLLRQKSRSLKAASVGEARAKLVKFAMGRGFDYDIVERCIDSFMGEAEA